MPAIVNVAANLILGASLALACRRSNGLQRSPMSWPLVLLTAFESLIVTPVATFLFRFYPAWSLLYGFDPQVHPWLEHSIGWLSAVAVVANLLAALGGYFIAREALLRGAMRVAAAPVVVGVATVALIAILYGPRIAFVGDYDAFWQGRATLVFNSLPGWLGGGLYLCSFLFVLWVYSLFGRREQPHGVAAGARS